MASFNKGDELIITIPTEKEKDGKTLSRQYVNLMLEHSGLTLTKATKKLNEKYPDDKTTTQNISNKLARGSLRDFEIAQLADVCGFDLILKTKDDSHYEHLMTDPININELALEGYESFDAKNFDVIVIIGRLANKALMYYLDEVNKNENMNAIEEIALCHFIEKRFNVVCKVINN